MSEPRLATNTFPQAIVMEAFVAGIESCVGPVIEDDKGDPGTASQV